MLDTGADVLVRLRQRFPHAPEPLGLGAARGDYGVDGDALLECLLQRTLKQCGQSGVRSARRQLHQRIVLVDLVEGITEIGVCSQDIQARAVHVFECRDAVAARFAQSRQKHRRRLDAWHRHHGGGTVGGEREQLENGGGDDTQASLGTEKQLFQIVAGIVLAQSA